MNRNLLKWIAYAGIVLTGQYLWLRGLVPRRVSIASAVVGLFLLIVAGSSLLFSESETSGH